MDKLAYDLSNLIERFKPSNQQAMDEADEMAKVAGLLESLGLRAPAAPAPSGGGGMGALAPIAALIALAGGAYAFRDKLGLGGGEESEDGKLGDQKSKNPGMMGGGKGGMWEALMHGKRPDVSKQEPKFPKPQHTADAFQRKPYQYPKVHKVYGSKDVIPPDGPKASVLEFLQSLLGQ